MGGGIGAIGTSAGASDGTTTSAGGGIGGGGIGGGGIGPGTSIPVSITPASVRGEGIGGGGIGGGIGPIGTSDAPSAGVASRVGSTGPQAAAASASAAAPRIKTGPEGKGSKPGARSAAGCFARRSLRALAMVELRLPRTRATGHRARPGITARQATISAERAGPPSP